MYNDVKVYNVEGLLVDTLELKEDISWISGRVSKGDSGVYYKGVGQPYTCHYEFQNANVELFQPFGCKTYNSNWSGLSGIFIKKFNPNFKDFIGACGPKERKIIEQSKAFCRSGVEVIDYVEWDCENLQSYYILNYTDNRRSFVNCGEVSSLLELLDYMLNEHWNISFDKHSLSDISETGLVFDVADLFISEEPKHKLGTVFSFVHGLLVNSMSRYNDFRKEIGMSSAIGSPCLMPTLSYLKCPSGCLETAVRACSIFGFNFGLEEFIIKEDYRYIISSFLLDGYNFAYGETKENGEEVKLAYFKQYLCGG